MINDNIIVDLPNEQTFAFQPSNQLERLDHASKYMLLLVPAIILNMSILWLMLDWIGYFTLLFRAIKQFCAPTAATKIEMVDKSCGVRIQNI